jgi:hypothetical protein
MARVGWSWTCVIQQWIGKKSKWIQERRRRGRYISFGSGFLVSGALDGHTLIWLVSPGSTREFMTIPSVCLGSISSSEHGKLLPLDAIEGPLQGVRGYPDQSRCFCVGTGIVDPPVDTGSLVSFWAKARRNCPFSLCESSLEAIIQVRIISARMQAKESTSFAFPPLVKTRL